MKRVSRTAALLVVAGWAAAVSAAGFTEDFASEPFARGWATFGNAQLFRWDSTGQNLQVTWDSSSTNSYFYHPLGPVLGKHDDVQLSFDLQIEQIGVGVNPDKPFTFELAVGLINVRDATGPGFLRGTGNQSPNLLEFDYFPDSGFGATVSPVIVSSNNQFVPAFTAPLELSAGGVYHIQMQYTAASHTLATTIQRDGETLGPVKQVALGPAFTDYQVDAISVSSYSDEGAGGSMLATGSIDNLAVRFPDPLTVELRGVLVDGIMHAAFTGSSNWLFTLERTDDWKEWQPVAGPVSGAGELVLQDETRTAPDGGAFYRVRAERGQ